MDTPKTPVERKGRKRSALTDVQELVGAIVLKTQDAEHYLKMILPFMDARDPSLSGVLARHSGLERKTFGEVVGKFVDATNPRSGALRTQLATLVERRNQIVHHFAKTYGGSVRAGRPQEMFASLRQLLADVESFTRTLQLLAVGLAEALRDTTYAGTDDYQAMAGLCASFRDAMAIRVDVAGDTKHYRFGDPTPD